MSFLGQEEQLRAFQERFRYVGIALVVGMLFVVGRMMYLQLISGDRMQRYSEENRIKSVKIRAPRGMIFDRNRTLLIDNRPSFDVEIVPQYLNESGEKEAVLKRVSNLIHMPLGDIEKRLQRARGIARFLPVKIRTEISRDDVARLETWKLDLPGVQVAMEIERTNVYGDVGSQFLGYVSKVNERELKRLNRAGKAYELGDSAGKVGIERRMEKTLRGQDGEELVQVDALGRRVREDETRDFLGSRSNRAAIPGRNLILTIDQDLQLAAKEAFQENAGSLVAIDPRNGEILAMISRPSFDSTRFSRGIPADLWAKLLNDERRPLKDKTIQDHYSPGSVFKVVTAIAGLEEGIINEHTHFNCPGYFRVGRRVFRCNKAAGHGDVNVVQALEMSCNVFFQKLAQRLGSVDQIAKWARVLGLGQRSGVDLPREVPGLIPTEAWKQKRFGRPWQGGETAAVAIGQSFVLTNVMQLAKMYAAIANGGTTFRPFYIQAIESPEGELIERFLPERLSQEEKISPKTIEIVKKGLWSVINERHGTGHTSKIPGADFAGKTGTAQLVTLAGAKIFQRCDEMPFNLRHHAVFAGFAPADNPVIAVAVLTEHGCHGSSGAAPIARAVVETYLKKYYPERLAPSVQAGISSEEWVSPPISQAAPIRASQPSNPKAQEHTP